MPPSVITQQTALTLNQSKIKMWRRCQKQYAFRYDYAADGKELVPQRKKLPLYRGSWLHALQQALHYQWAEIPEFEIRFGEGKRALKITATSWVDVHEALADQFDELFDEEKEDIEDLPDDCERLFKAYLRFWDEDQDTYTVASYKGKPMIEFLIEASLSLQFKFKGRVDLVVEDMEYGGFWLWDAKWVGRIPAPEERMMSPQAMMYVWALRNVYDLDIRGFVFNYGRTKAPKLPRVLRDGTLSVAQRMDTDLYTYYRSIKELHGKRYKEYMPYYADKLKQLKGREALWFRRERIPVEDVSIAQALEEFMVSGNQIHHREEPETAPRSYFYNCKFNCDYHDPCVAEFTGLNIEPILRNQFEEVSERYAEDKEDLLAG